MFYIYVCIVLLSHICFWYILTFFFFIKNILILIFMRYYGSFARNKKRTMLYVQLVLLLSTPKTLSIRGILVLCDHLETDKFILYYNLTTLSMFVWYDSKGYAYILLYALLIWINWIKYQIWYLSLCLVFVHDMLPWYMINITLLLSLLFCILILIHLYVYFYSFVIKHNF